MYIKRFTNIEKTSFNYYLINPDQSERLIPDPEKSNLLQRWLLTNTPVEYDYVPPIVKNAEDVFSALPYDVKIAKVVAFRMAKMGYPIELCTGVMANCVRILQVPENERTENDLLKLAEGNALEQLRQQIIQQVYIDYPRPE